MMNCGEGSIRLRYCTAKTRKQRWYYMEYGGYPISHLSYASCAHGLTTRRPSFGGAAARLNDYVKVSPCLIFLLNYDCTNVVTLFPCSSGTESETNECGPCAALEQEDGEDDTKAEAEAGADHHRGETAVPLRMYCQHSHLAAL
jgi:hypothetical protein